MLVFYNLRGEGSLFLAGSRMVQPGGLLSAAITDQHQVVALHVGAVLEIRRLAAAVRALADRLGVIRKVHGHTIIEDAQCTFPESVITVALTVLYDAAVDLIHVFKPTFFHHRADDFTANPARAIRHDFFIFDVIVFVTLKLGYEITRGIRIRHHGIFELADFRFVLVATVKEHHAPSLFLDELGDLFPLQVFSPTDDSIFIYLELVL